MDSVPPEQILQEISAFKSHFSVIHGDFKARSKSWWNSVNNTNEGIKIDVGTSSLFTAINISTNTSVSKSLFLS